MNSLLRQISFPYSIEFIDDKIQAICIFRFQMWSYNNGLVLGAVVQLTTATDVFLNQISVSSSLSLSFVATAFSCFHIKDFGCV